MVSDAGGRENGGTHADTDFEKVTRLYHLSRW